jgi:hypothetical protein
MSYINTLKDRTIQEYLNQDRNRSSYIAHQIRRAVNRFEGVQNPETYEQFNQMELRNAESSVNDFKIRLLDTFNHFNTLYQNNDYMATGYSQLYNRIGNYTSTLVEYNKVVSLYLNTDNNIGTRQSIYSLLMQTREAFFKLEEISNKVLEQYVNISDRDVQTRTINKYFVKILLLLSLYNIITSQFSQNRVFYYS